MNPSKTKSKGEPFFKVCYAQVTSQSVGKLIRNPEWLFLAVFLVRGTVSGEIEKLKNCGRRVLCHGKSPQDYEDQFNPKIGSISPCYCDKKCAEFGDCCIDVAPYPNKRSGNSWACVPLTFNESVYAVSNCGLNHGPWKERCKKNISSDKYHYILDIPIFSNLTGLYYSNIYCAFCNNQMTSIAKPRLSVTCSNNITVEMLLKLGIYQIGKLNWKVGGGICSIFTDEVKPGRPCVHSISDCPDDLNPVLSAKCKAYSMIISKLDETYQNPHCALCNGVNDNDLRCWYGNKYRTLPSLSMILDFDWNFDSCHVPESVWDGLQQRCTSINSSTEKNCETTCNNSDASCNSFQNQQTLKIEGYITFICLSISVICLLLHIFISALIPHPKTLPSKVLDSLSVSLMIAQSLFLCGIYPAFNIPKDICKTIAVLIQFFYLASFFWMNTMSFDVCNTFSNASLKNNSEKSHTKYAFYAWGGATLVTGFSVTTDLTNFIPDNYHPHYAARANVCWFGNRIGLAIFFYFPIFLLLLLNSILFTITVIWFQKHHNSSETLKTSGRKEYNRLWLYIKLSTIMGMSWAFGVIASITNIPHYRYPFTVLNGLQGAFIFIMFDLKTEVALIFLKQIGIIEFREKSSNHVQSDGTQSSRVSTSAAKT